MKSAPFIRSAIALAVVSLFAGCSQWNDLVRGNQSSTVGTAPAARSGTIVVGEPAGTSRSSVVVSEPASSTSMAAARPSEPTATGTATATSAARNTTNSGNNEIGTAATNPTYGGGTPRSAIAAAEAAGQTSTAMNAPPATTAQIAPPATSQPSRLMVSDVRSAQQALKDDGYNVGPIDGKMGPKTSAALRKFQKDHGIQATGRLDSQTMAALGSSTGSTS